ncbi:MAG: M20/M25/M40 family metallo-hydrolase, partial [Actinomycetota bacterium]
VLEPAAGPNVKVARKGTGSWRIEVLGRAAHAGLAPEEGINAVLELAELIRRLDELARPDDGTTATVTMLGGGSAANVVPERAWCTVDVRMWTDEEADRLAGAFGELRPVTPGARVQVTGGMNRGPLEREAAEELYARLGRLGYDVGAAEVGGASDGNLTAALGVPTLDGLGPVGGGAHARHEHVLVEEMPRRAEMVARLLTDLAADG